MEEKQITHRVSNEIFRASEGDIPMLADTLANAFNNDPCFVWIFRNDSKRLEAITSFFSFILKNAYPEGEVYASNNFEAWAIWYQPGKGLRDDSPERVSLLKPLMLEWTTEKKIDARAYNEITWAKTS